MNNPKLRRSSAPFPSACFRIGLLTSLLLAMSSLRASTLESAPPNSDAWVESAAPAVTHNDGTLVVAAGKEVFIRFVVSGDQVDSAPAKTAFLKLKKTTANAATVTVHAANNNWGETGITWTTRPTAVTTPALASVSAAGGAGTVISFDVTEYISGSGAYTFCLRNASATAVTFYSDEATTTGNRPMLEIQHPGIVNVMNSTAKQDDLEYRRTVSEVLIRGDEYIARYIAANGGAGSAADTDVNKIGFFDVTKFPYGANGADTNDDTNAIQRAVNEARDARVALYFPPGTYIVSKTIECVQGVIDYSTAPFADTNGERWNQRDFACLLVGDPANPATIKLAANSFNDAADPQPVLRVWSRGNNYNLANDGVTATGISPETNMVGVNYNQTIQNLNIDLNAAISANGNRGAIGIDMAGAQGVSMNSITIAAHGGYAGIQGTPGPGGSTSDITINGGKYGVDSYNTTSSQVGGGSVLTDCTINDDTSGLVTQAHSVRWNGLGTMVMVGCKITGKPIRIDGPSGQTNASGSNVRGNLCLVDSTIDLGVVGPAVLGTRSVYLRNVYCKDVNPIAAIDTTGLVTGGGDAGSVASGVAAGNWFKVTEYAEGAKVDPFTPKSPHNLTDTDGIQITPSYVTGSVTTAIQSSIGASLGAGFPAAATTMLGKHAWPAIPKWSATTTSTIINVKNMLGAGLGGVTANAVGDSTANDAPAIQAAINAAAPGQVVFIPRGEYSLKSTLTLKAGTILIGLNKNVSRLKASEATGSVFIGAAPIKPLVQSQAATTATIAELMLLQRQSASNAYLLDWQSDGVVQNINFDRRNSSNQQDLNAPLVLIQGNTAGGKWYNFWADGAAAQGAPNYRHLKVLNTIATKPLKFYMLNPESDTKNIFLVEISNCDNVDVFGSKWESKQSPLFKVANSDDIRWFGFTGNAVPSVTFNTTVSGSGHHMEVGNCSNFLIAGQTLQYSTETIGIGGNTYTATDPRSFNRVEETNSTGTLIGSTPGQKQFVVYRRGTPNDAN